MRPVWIGLVLVASVVPVGAAAGDEGRETSDPQAVRQLDRRFTLNDREASALERRLMEKSEEAVIRLLGRPERGRGPDGHLRLNYRFGREWLTVSVRDGRVIATGYGERQTGVREDDFVGLVGP
jgi:hypothetical protein